MDAAEGQATENERAQLCLNGGNEPSGNSGSLINEQQQIVTHLDSMVQQYAQLELQTVDEQRERAQEAQRSGIDVQGAQTDFDCEFCSTVVHLFNAICPPGREIHAEVPRNILGSMSDLLSSNCCHTTWLRHIGFGGISLPLHEFHSVELIQGPAPRTCARLWAGFPTKSLVRCAPTLPFELIFRAEVPGHRGRGRILRRDWIDIEQISHWRSRCIEEHGGRCDKLVLGALAPFRPWWLIDVVQECIVPSEDGEPRFLTLSYTWGKTENFLTKKHNLSDLRKPGALLSGFVAANIPETIRNAIALTKALGETRLWIDSLCIVQDDEATLQYHLENMHRIYASSFLTIVAQNGQDAEFGLRGLRGVSAARVADQDVLPLAAGERLLMMGGRSRQCESSIYDYDQRMWTFQEWTFAKRRLAFTPFGSVKWECNCAEWDEHLHYYAEGEIYMDDVVASGLKSRIPSLHALVQVFREFNRRNLTYDEDVLSAFSGIQTHFNDIFPSGFLFGQPELFFDISLCWFAWRNLRRRTVSDKFTGDPTRDGLPSWSWMGWQGNTLLPSDAEHQPAREMGFTESVTKWYCAELPSSTSPRPIHTRWHEFRAAAAERKVDMDGWTCMRFELPPPWRGGGTNNLYFTPEFMPKQMPKRMYRRHGLDDACSTGLWWYPVPVTPENARPGEDSPEISQQCQFIRCETTRAFLNGSTELALEMLEDHDPNPIQPLNDNEGNAVGGLILHHRKDYLFFKEKRTVELVAIVKGWISTLGRFNWAMGEDHTPAKDGKDKANDSKTEGREDVVHESDLTQSEESDQQVCSSPRNSITMDHDGDVVHESDLRAPEENNEEDSSSYRSLSPAEDEEDVVSDSKRTALEEEKSQKDCSYKSDGIKGIPWISAWERQRQSKHDHIFVLWITWDHGVAYRKASGFVLAEKWAELKEPGTIDLILG